MQPPASEDVTDWSLLERIASGDSSAVKECLTRYGSLVWGLSRRYMRSSADAEDATQEIFLSIWRNAHVFDSAKGTEIGFIAMLARRRLIDQRRKWHAELAIDFSIEVEDTNHWVDSDTSSPTQLDAEQAMKALACLRPDWRRTLELAFVEGLSQSEISARLSLPLGTVKSRMRRGLMRMRELLHVEPEPRFSKMRKASSRVANSSGDMKAFRRRGPVATI